MSPHEAVTASFVAWERRGRGGIAGDGPVHLEPPHRPFFVLPELLHPFITPSWDDGRVPPWWRRLFGGRREAPAPPEPYKELDPFPREFPYEPFAFKLLIPEDHATGSAATRALLQALTGALDTIVFELVGTAGKVTCSIVCNVVDRAHVAATLRAYLPASAIEEGADVLDATWRDDTARARIEYGLFREFFLPLPMHERFSPDPYMPLVAALTRAGESECLCMQVLIETTWNQWGKTIIDAVTDPNDDTCIFEDAPELLDAAHAKTETPIYAVSVRLGAMAEHTGRLRTLIAGFDGCFEVYGSARGNALVPQAIEAAQPGEDDPCIPLRLSRRTGMLLSLDELVGLVHIPDASVQYGLVRMPTRTFDESENGLALGIHGEGQDETLVRVPLEDRFAHTHAVGASGTGKSSFLLSLIVQDMDEGHGIAVIDPHGDLTSDILALVPASRHDDVIVFDPSDETHAVGLNVLHAATPHEKTLLASDLVATIERYATAWGDGMSALLDGTIRALLDNEVQGTLVDAHRFLVDEAFREARLATVTDDATRFFWTDEVPLIGMRSLGPLATRLGAFVRHPLIRATVGQHGKSLHLGTLMQEGKILLARLPIGLMGATQAGLLGSLLVTKFQQYAVARQAIPKAARRPFFLYADECQHFVTPSLASLFSEGRKYRFGLTLAHQMLTQLDRVPEVRDAVLSNAHTRVVFRTDVKDARVLAEGFASFDHAAIAGLNRGEAIVRMGRASNDALISTWRVDVPDESTQRDALIEQSRARYATPRAAVEEELRARYAQVPKAAVPAAKNVQAPTLRPVPHLVSVPAALDDVMPGVQVQREDTGAQPPVKPEDEAAAAPPPEEPTPEASLAPEPVAAPKPPRKPRAAPVLEVVEPGKGGAEHKYMQHLLKRLAEERGCRAVIEEAVPDGQVDVALYRGDITIACEISVTTDLEHELGNVRKCVRSTEFTHVLCVVHKPRMRERMTAALKELAGAVPVTVIGPESLPAMLETLLPSVVPQETQVKGYAVKVSRRATGAATAGQADGRRVIGEIIAKAVKKAGAG